VCGESRTHGSEGAGRAARLTWLPGGVPDDLGVEFAILDCVSFLRYYMHFFHRKRQDFLRYYQELVLEEPESSVRHGLKTAWLSLRAAMEGAMAGIPEE
jgi:hypothetical protein